MSAELVHALAQVVDTNHQIVAALRMALPQWYGVKELKARWNRGEDAVRDLVRTHTAYKGEVGKALSIHLSDVLAIDELLVRQDQARVEHARRTA